MKSCYTYLHIGDCFVFRTYLLSVESKEIHERWILSLQKAILISRRLNVFDHKKYPIASNLHSGRPVINPADTPSSEKWNR
jgi:hypothetical protein